MVKVRCVLLVAVVGYLQAAKLPNFIVPCSKSDPNLQECAKKHGQDAIPFIIKGSPEFNVPSLAPLFLPEVQFSTGDLHVDLTNVTLNGLERAVIKEVLIELEDQHMGVAVSIDQVTIVADYNISGSLLTVPLSGNGTVGVTLVDGEYQYHFNYTLKGKWDRQYMEIKDDEVTFRGRGAHFQFDYGGNSQRGQQLNKLVEENWETLQKEVAPAIAKTVRSVIKSIVSGFIDKVPFHRIFLP